MQPMTDVREISKLAYGFMGTQALVSALNINLFGILGAQEASLDELAGRTSVSRDRLEMLLTPLVALGVLAMKGDLFENSPAAARYLDPGRPEYFGEYIRLQIGTQIYPHALNMGVALQGSPVQIYTEVASNPEEAADFSHSQHVGSLGPAYLLAKTSKLDSARSMLDIAGGSGAFAISFLSKYPNLRVELLDFPEVTKVARHYVEEAGMQDRVSYLSGNALEMEWSGDQDVVLMSYLLSGVGRPEIESLFTKAHAALKPGGTLLVHDFMANDDKTGPVSAGLWMLTLISSPKPALLTPAYFKERANAAGFAEPHVAELIPTITGYLQTRKA